METKTRVATCQQCGIGFVVTENYSAFLKRWGARAVVPVQCLSCFRKSGLLDKEQGTIRWFNERKGYGFIADQEGLDIYFHQSQILDANRANPQEGQAARFHTRYTPKGTEALNIELQVMG